MGFHLYYVLGAFGRGGLAKPPPSGNGAEPRKQKGPHPKVRPLLPEEPDML
jgi:hypothetical protein